MRLSNSWIGVMQGQRLAANAVRNNLFVNTFQCTAQIGKLKTESGFEEPLRRAAAAGERQGRFGSHQPRTQAHAPSWRWRTRRAMQHSPQFAHKFLVCNRTRCRGVE